MASGKTVRKFDFELDGDFFTEFRSQEGPLLGVGLSGEVVLATSVDDPNVVRAVKKFELQGPGGSDEDAARDETTLRHYLREVDIMKRLHHPNVMTMYAAVRTPRYLAIVMPYFAKGALSSRIKTLSFVQQASFIKQITKAVAYLHRKNVIHGDIKPQNVLVDDSDNALLADFGLSRAVPNQRVEIFVDFGTQSYRAPETWSDERVSPFKTDMYSLGVTIWAIIMKKRPKYWINFLEELDTNAYVPVKYRRILASLLDVDPAKRLTASEVLEDL